MIKKAGKYKKAIIGSIFICIICAPLSVIVLQDFLILPALYATKRGHWDDVFDKIHPRVESVFLETSDGASLETWRVPVKSKSPGKRKAAIIFNGNGGNIKHMTRHLIDFSEAGITGYAMEYRGVGRSTGWPSERKICEDAEMVWDYVIEKEQIEAEDIILYGLSFGTGPAAYLAKKKQPGILVLMAPYTSLSDVVKGRGVLKYCTPFMWYEFPIKEYIVDLDVTCVIVAHGDNDTLIPISHTEKLESVYKGNGWFYKIVSPGTTHMNIYANANEDVFSKIDLCLGLGN